MLLVRVGANIYALPLNALRETLRLSPMDVEVLHGQPDGLRSSSARCRCIGSRTGWSQSARRQGDQRGRPTVGEGRPLGIAPGPGRVASIPGGRLDGVGPWQALVIRLTRGDEAWLVDELVGKQQVVIKPLSPYLGTIRGVEGTAILPDGAVTLVLDVESLSQV